jgi:hypothetical protein
MTELPSPQTPVYEPEHIQLVRDDHAWMRVEYGPDQAMPAAWIADEETEGLQVRKQLSLPETPDECPGIEDRKLPSGEGLIHESPLT